MLAAAAIATPVPHLLPYLSQQIDFSQKTAPFLVKKLLFLVSWNSSLKTGKLSSFQPLPLPPHIDKIILRWDENRLITEFSFGAAWERPPCTGWLTVTACNLRCLCNFPALMTCTHLWFITVKRSEARGSTWDPQWSSLLSTLCSLWGSRDRCQDRLSGEPWRAALSREDWFVYLFVCLFCKFLNQIWNPKCSTCGDLDSYLVWDLFGSLTYAQLSHSDSLVSDFRQEQNLGGSDQVPSSHSLRDRKRLVEKLWDGWMGGLSRRSGQGWHQTDKLSRR